MTDLLYVVLTVVFFALAVGLVRGCDRVIGPDEAMHDSGGTDAVR